MVSVFSIHRPVSSEAHNCLFECSVLTIVTRLPERNGCAVVLLEAVAELQRRTIASPSVEVGAICHSRSGARALPVAMHSRFLYHAVPKGMNNREYGRLASVF